MEEEFYPSNFKSDNNPELPPTPIPRKETPQTQNLSIYNNMPYPEKQKERILKNWNDNPEVKNNGITAIDTKKKKPVKKKIYAVLVILSIFGILFLIIISGAIIWSVYKEGSLVPNFNMTCPDVTIEEGAISCGDTACPDVEIPSCPLCPDCNCKVYCGNETWS